MTESSKRLVEQGAVAAVVQASQMTTASNSRTLTSQKFLPTIQQSHSTSNLVDTNKENNGISPYHEDIAQVQT